MSTAQIFFQPSVISTRCVRGNYERRARDRFYPPADRGGLERGGHCLFDDRGGLERGGHCLFDCLFVHVVSQHVIVRRLCY
jgi:hypothetical protein